MSEQEELARKNKDMFSVAKSNRYSAHASLLNGELQPRVSQRWLGCERRILVVIGRSDPFVDWGQGTRVLV